jgi:hypothetical protein
MPDNSQHPSGTEPPAPRTRLFWICYEAIDEKVPAAEPDSQDHAGQESVPDANPIPNDGQACTRQPPSVEPPGDLHAVAPDPSAEDFVHPSPQVRGQSDLPHRPRQPEATAPDQETNPSLSGGRRDPSSNVRPSPTSQGRRAAGRKRVRRSLPLLQDHEAETPDP